MIAAEDLASAVGAYRLNLALQLARQHSPFAPVSEPVLSAFPGLMADHHLLSEFLVKWRDITTKLSTAADVSFCRQSQYTGDVVHHWCLCSLVQWKSCAMTIISQSSYLCISGTSRHAIERLLAGHGLFIAYACKIIKYSVWHTADMPDILDLEYYITLR